METTVVAVEPPAETLFTDLSFPIETKTGKTLTFN
jgi:hypothetical protein